MRQLSKEKFLEELESNLTRKIQQIQLEIEQLRLDISSDTKNTAGDKHETSRAMAQLEMEKLGKQFSDYQKQLHATKQFLLHASQPSSDGITVGSLVELRNGLYFLGLGIGKVDVEHTSVFCISIQSPLGQQMLDKKIGQEVILPNLRTSVLAIY